MRAPLPRDRRAVGDVLTEAGTLAWGSYLGEERVRAVLAESEPRADLVAEDAEGVIGFVSWEPETGEIVQLFTHPRAWGRGAGRALLDTALDVLRAAGRTQAWLNTEERNDRARAFYARHGWREDGPPRVRDWHGSRLVEPRYVKDL